MGGPLPPGAKLLRGRISKPALVLPAPNRLDPLAPPPVISKHDAQRVCIYVSIFIGTYILCSLLRVYFL